MTSISHNSVPFQITLSIPTHHSRLKTRQSSIRRFVSGGLQLEQGHCDATDGAKASTGMLHASYLAGAALNAAATFSDFPFRFFFAPKQETANTVAGVMTRVILAQLGQGPPIFVGCRDITGDCKRHRRGGGTAAYMAQLPGGIPPLIVICPSGLTLPPNPPPCSTAFKDAAAVGIAAHEGKDTTTDANAYVFLGTWAWDLGFGNQQKTCMERFPTGKFRTSGLS